MWARLVDCAQSACVASSTAPALVRCWQSPVVARLAVVRAHAFACITVSAHAPRLRRLWRRPTCSEVAPARCHWLATAAAHEPVGTQHLDGRPQRRSFGMRDACVVTRGRTRERRTSLTRVARCQRTYECAAVRSVCARSHVRVMRQPSSANRHVPAGRAWEAAAATRRAGASRAWPHDTHLRIVGPPHRACLTTPRHCARCRASHARTHSRLQRTPTLATRHRCAARGCNGHSCADDGPRRRCLLYTSPSPRD